VRGSDASAPAETGGMRSSGGTAAPRPNRAGMPPTERGTCILASQRSAPPPPPRQPASMSFEAPWPPAAPGILAAREMSGASGSSFPLVVVLSSRRQFGGKQLVSSFRCRPASASSSHPAPDPRVCDTSALPAESRPLRRRFFCRQGGRISFGASCFQTLQQQVDQAAASFPAGNSR
jgi:hypothetical protein